MMQARVCLNLRAEVESTGGWVLHEVGVPLPWCGPKEGKPGRPARPATARRRARKGRRPTPPGAAHTIRIDFLVAWPDGRWCLVEAKHPDRVHRDWAARAGALRTWYGRDPLFGGLEERAQ